VGLVSRICFTARSDITDLLVSGTRQTQHSKA
jgi:hypothetical protein